MSAFIDEHRARFGVEPICRTLGVSVSAYYHRASGARSERDMEDVRLLEVIELVPGATTAPTGTARRGWHCGARP